jgi:hypothetical protein
MSEMSPVTVLSWLILLIVWSIVGFSGLILSLLLTNPLALGPAGVTLWFVLLFTSLASVITLGLYLVKWYLKLHSTGVARLRYAWRHGMLIAAWIVGLLALASLRQFGLLDAILLGILLVIVEVYVRFRWP